TYTAFHHPALHSFPTRRSSDLGAPIVGNGQFGPYFYTPSLMTDRMLRISFGPGYQFSEHLAVKLEYTLDRRHVIAPRSEDTHLRSEEHTSELQSRSDLVCRLLL